MKISRRLFLACSAAQVALASPHAPATAQEVFPRRTIGWVLPFPPGGFGDTLSRMLTQHMSTTLKSSVVVDNRPGASGQIAASHVKQMPADGHTLFNGDIGSFSMNAALYRKLNYDTLTDFSPVTRLVTSTLVLVVPPSSPLQTFDDLVRLAKTERDIVYGSFGVGSLSHIGVELIRRDLGGTFQHVSYRGSQEALRDLLAGRTDMMLDLVANSLPHVQAGNLRALAVLGTEKRLSNLSQIPTMSELGFPTLNAAGWNGVMVRSGTPAEVVKQLHAAVTQAILSDEIRRRFEDFGIFPAPQSPSEFGGFIASETARWASVIRGTGLVLD